MKIYITFWILRIRILQSVKRIFYLTSVYQQTRLISIWDLRIEPTQISYGIRKVKADLHYLTFQLLNLNTTFCYKEILWLSDKRYLKCIHPIAAPVSLSHRSGRPCGPFFLLFELNSIVLYLTDDQDFIPFYILLQALLSLENHQNQLLVIAYYPPLFISKNNVSKFQFKSWWQGCCWQQFKHLQHWS